MFRRERNTSNNEGLNHIGNSARNHLQGGLRTRRRDTSNEYEKENWDQHVGNDAVQSFINHAHQYLDGANHYLDGANHYLDGANHYLDDDQQNFDVEQLDDDQQNFDEEQLDDDQQNYDDEEQYYDDDQQYYDDEEQYYDDEQDFWDGAILHSQLQPTNRMLYKGEHFSWYDYNNPTFLQLINRWFLPCAQPLPVPNLHTIN